MKYLLFVLGVFLCSCSTGQSTEYNVEKGMAIEGYDPVSYFSGNPEKGRKSISKIYDGVTFHFYTEENKQAFINDPQKYTPAYGGWCAYAMGASGEKVSIDPKTYKIIDGKVYLFYNSWGNNTLESWNEDEKILKRKADENWSEIVK